MNNEQDLAEFSIRMANQMLRALYRNDGDHECNSGTFNSEVVLANFIAKKMREDGWRKLKPCCEVK